MPEPLKRLNASLKKWGWVPEGGLKWRRGQESLCPEEVVGDRNRKNGAHGEEGVGNNGTFENCRSSRGSIVNWHAARESGGRRSG